MRSLSKSTLRFMLLASAAVLAFSSCKLKDDPKDGVSDIYWTDLTQGTSSALVQSTASAENLSHVSMSDSSDTAASSDVTSNTDSATDTFSEVSEEVSYAPDPPPQHGMLTADLITDPVGSLPESEKVDPSYFDDAVFVGDSISVMLSYYEAAYDKLGGAKFLASGSLGSENATWPIADSVLPTYQGEKMYLWDSVPLTGANKLYIMLGMNDIAICGTDGAAENLKKLIERILENSPDMTVYVQSMTPITSTSNIYSRNHNPVKIKKYNEKLAAICAEKGWNYINIASAFADDDGYLKREYCSDPDDMGIHFNFVGCGKWIEYLYTHTS